MLMQISSIHFYFLITINLYTTIHINEAISLVLVRVIDHGRHHSVKRSLIGAHTLLRGHVLTCTGGTLNRARVVQRKESLRYCTDSDLEAFNHNPTT